MGARHKNNHVGMDILNIRVKKLDPAAVIPQYAKVGDAGMDLTAVSMTPMEDGKYKYDTGLAFEIPEGYVGLIFPRSSVSKKNLLLSNSVGVIDSGYRGPVMAVFQSTEDSPNRYSPGERCCQIVVMPHPTINFEDVGEGELTESDRGAGGFGSTGE